MEAAEAPRYEVAMGVHRLCSHGRGPNDSPGLACPNVIRHFAYPVGEDPMTVPVWCALHAGDARRAYRPTCP